MRTTTVFATATSSMHADLIVVGLKRVGISTCGISVLYPSYSQPDTVMYWLDGSARLALSPTGETVTVSGPLRLALEDHRTESPFPSLRNSLRFLGLTQEQSIAFEGALLEDRVVIGVEAADDSELAMIFHIFHHIGAEKIVIAETPVAARPSRAVESEPVFAGNSLSAA